MNVLITGGAGFIGSHTADVLIRAGHRVAVLDLLDPQIHGTPDRFPAYLHPEVKRIHGDVRRPQDLVQALQQVDAVYHFAALTGVGQSMYDLGPYVSTNCAGTAHLLEALVKRKRRLKRLVLASSRAVYGEGTHRCPRHGSVYPAARKAQDMARGNFAVGCPRCGREMRTAPTAEERPLLPRSLYAWTKRQQEEQGRFVAQTFGLPVTILRYFNVYGSRQSLNNPYTGVVSIFYARMQARQPISLYEGGRPARDFVHVSDVAQANRLALEADVAPGTCLNIGSGVQHTVRDLAEALGVACARTPKLEDRGEYRAGDIHACTADLTLAHRTLGYQPRTSLGDGLKEFVAWAHGQDSTDRYAQTVRELRRHGLFGRTARRTA